MNKKQLFNEKTTYVSPSCKSVEVQLNAILCQSGNSARYSGPNHAGNSMADDEDYRYDF